jgi:hypothetical protein
MNTIAVPGAGIASVGGTLLVVVGLAALLKGWQELGPAVAIYRNDPVSVQDLVYHDGPAEVEGTARGDEKGVKTPFTDTVCLAYEYEVEEYQSSGKHSHWKSLEEGNNWVKFLVEDDTGAVQINGADAELHLSEETLELSPGEDPPERIARYMAESDEIEQQDSTLDLGITELTLGNKQRFIERRLDLDESVHVYGTVGRAPAGEWGSNQVDAMLTSDANTPLVISDSSERGTVWRIIKNNLGWPLFGLVCFLIGLYGILLAFVPVLG